jgi:MerR family transcriptional regulator, copper efflux regulator
MDTIGIGALAKHAGVGIDTVRYYERNGLLSPKARLASGYRRYGAAELSRLRFIRRAQVLGFSLKEVRELLALSKRRDVARVKRVAERRLADVEQRIANMKRVRNGLISLIAACPGHGPLDACPILNALGGEDPAGA